jgi:hypothetical protein
MGEFYTDRLDEACEIMFGHTDWSYMDSLSPEEKHAIGKDDAVIVFFAKARPEFLEDEELQEEDDE